MKAFDPTNHNFAVLPDHTPLKKVRFYEYKSHACVDGTVDYNRLNYYLSQDEDFVTVWQGLLEPAMLDTLFEKSETPLIDYNESLFRGYIESEEQGEHILKALRLESMEPQILVETPEERIVCKTLEDHELECESAASSAEIAARH